MPSWAANGIRVGRQRHARLMTQGGLAGVSWRRFVVTTVNGDSRQAPDLVKPKTKQLKGSLK
jgi:transposase InsO family protein